MATVSDTLQISHSKEFGASFAVFQLAKELQLALCATNKQWVKDCLAMIVGSLVYADSKLPLCSYKDTALWELCGAKIDEQSLDFLLARQEAIQQKLANKHRHDKILVVYDITSDTFAELICTTAGCPIGVEVLPATVTTLQQKYQAAGLVFVGKKRPTKLQMQEWDDLNMQYCVYRKPGRAIQVLALDVKLTEATLDSYYKELTLIKGAMRKLKSNENNMFVCMLAYYLQWHMTKRLQPGWTLAKALTVLKNIRSADVSVGGTSYKVVTTPDNEQLEILELLNIQLPSQLT